MKKIDINNTKEIIGGSISGAFLSGISDIIKSVGDLINKTIGNASVAVIGGIEMISKNAEHGKFKMSFGNNPGIEYDDSKKFDFEMQKYKNEHAKHEKEFINDLSSDKNYNDSQSDDDFENSTCNIEDNIDNINIF